jgi:7-cyano-7-deazaguanine reductase
MRDVAIRYVPEDKIVELKSLKYYFISFRSVGIYQEDATNRIYNDLKDLLSPKFLEVKTRYKTRGGIEAECSMRSDAQMKTDPIDIR